MTKRARAQENASRNPGTGRELRLSRLIPLGLVVALVWYVFLYRSPEDTAYVSEIDSYVAAIRTAQIQPNPAYTLNTLEIHLETRHWALKDSLTFQWFCNGNAIPSESGPSLGPERFRKGDEISAEVRLMASAYTAAYRTRAIRIQNTPPRILSASTVIEQDPKPAAAVRVQSLDADGDPLKYTFSWFRNGERIPEASQATMDPTHLRRGDKIYAEVVAYDGEEKSPPMMSDVLHFENNPPRILSEPPPSVSEDRRFVYQLKIEDADGDSLSFELVQSPTGMIIGTDGIIDWSLPPKAEGTWAYPVEIRVKDTAGGEATQSFSITVSGTIANKIE